MISNLGNILVWGVIVLLGALFSDYFLGRSQDQKITQVTLTDIKIYADTGALQYVEVQDGIITGYVHEDDAVRIVRAYLGDHSIPIVHDLVSRYVPVKILRTSGFHHLINILIGLLPIGLLLFAQYWNYSSFSRSGSGGIFGIDKIIARSPEQSVKTTFADIAGADEAKAEFSEIIAFLRDPYKFTRIGARLPKGILLVGPPGCGKTLFSRATAGEAGCAFFYVSASEFVEMFVGLGAKRVRDVFKAAKKLNSPCIIFIDEIDAIGKKRTSGSYGGGNDERESTLNQLLVEMDGFDQDDRIIVLGATNRPEILDEALKRSGRFDRLVSLELPDRRARTDILRLLTKKFTCSEVIDWVELAKTTEGFSGADLSTVVNEAAIFAAMEDRSIITQADLERARDKIMIGPEKKSLIVTEEEKKLTAYHEAGHALVAWKTGVMDKIVKVTIRAAGRSLGRTAFIQGDHVHKTKKMI